MKKRAAKVPEARANNCVVALSGTPGVGKSTVLKELKELGFDTFELNQIIKSKKLYEKYDAKDKTRDVDVEVLTKYVKKFILADSGGRIALDSHLSHHLPPELIDLCVIVKCELRELRRRLEKRKYPKRKVRENLDCEIFDICLVEALENGHEVFVVDATNEKPAVLAEKILDRLKNI